MALSAFSDKSQQPTETQLTETLDATRCFWDDLIAYMLHEHNSVTQEWKYYGLKAGWSLLLKKNSRTILYLYPGIGFFIVLFVFGEKAVATAQQNGLPEEIIALVNNARPYIEGRSFQVPVRTQGDLEQIKKLVRIKLAH